MTTLVVLALLGQAPIELVPLEPEAAPRPSALRVFASIGAGLAVTGVASAGATYVNSIPVCAPRTGGGGCLVGRYALLAGVSLLGTALTTVGMWLVHRALDGKSGIGWTILGSLTASLFGAAAGLVIGVAATGHIEPLPMVIGGGVFSAVAGGLMSEVGHLRAQ